VQQVPNDALPRTAGRYPRKPRKRLLGFSVPLTIETTLALAWAFQHDLGIVQDPRNPNSPMENHAR